MRPSQFDMTVILFEAGGGEPRTISVYSDAIDMHEALAAAFAAATARLFGTRETPTPAGGRCDVTESDDADRPGREHAELARSLAEKRDPELYRKCEQNGECLVHASLRRFAKAVPANYPKDEQEIEVDCHLANPFKALTATLAALEEQLRRFEPLPSSKTLAVRTNSDPIGQGLEGFIPWEPRVDAYFRNMRLHEGVSIRVRFLDKVFKAALDIRYTDAERRAVLGRLVEESLEEPDPAMRCLGLAYAHKINSALGADMRVPEERADETVMASNEWKHPPEAVMKVLEERKSKITLSFLDSLKPDDEILELYNVYISKDHFYHWEP